MLDTAIHVAATGGDFLVQWIWLAVGVVGIGGVIAALVFAPAVSVPIFQAVMRFLLATRPGWGLMFGLAGFIAADIHRARLDQRDWEKRVAAFDQAQKQRDERIAADTRAAVTKELAAETAAATATDKQVSEFEHGLPPIPDDKNCASLLRVGDDADKLRSIAGQAVRRSQGTKRVPTHRWTRPGPQN